MGHDGVNHWLLAAVRVLQKKVAALEYEDVRRAAIVPLEFRSDGVDDVAVDDVCLQDAPICKSEELHPEVLELASLIQDCSCMLLPSVGSYGIVDVPFEPAKLNRLAAEFVPVAQRPDVVAHVRDVCFEVCNDPSVAYCVHIPHEAGSDTMAGAGAEKDISPDVNFELNSQCSAEGTAKKDILIEVGVAPAVALQLESKAAARLAATMKNPENVQWVKSLITEFALGCEVEAALLLLDEATFDELLASEAEFRRRLEGLPDAAARVEKTLWIIRATDEAVEGLLQEGMKILAARRLVPTCPEEAGSSSKLPTSCSRLDAQDLMVDAAAVNSWHLDDTRSNPEDHISLEQLYEWIGESGTDGYDDANDDSYPCFVDAICARSYSQGSNEDEDDPRLDQNDVVEHSDFSSSHGAWDCFLEVIDLMNVGMASRRHQHIARSLHV